MASLVVAGDTSGAITIAAPAIAGTNTLTLPASTGTLVVTGGAQTIEFADGTVSAPSITNSGDTNTGIFFPAADTIAFTEGGVEAMRLDSSGNVGIGVTAGGRLDIAQVSRVRWDLSNSYVYQSVINTAGNAYQANIVDASQHQFYSSGVEVMRISTGQQVGIGKSPAVTLDVNGAFNYDPNVTTNGISVVYRATFNDGVNRELGAAWNNTFGVVTIKATGGNTNIPFFSNGGGGVAYAATAFDPDAGTWSYGTGPTITFTTSGTGGNTFVLAFKGGSGLFDLQRTAGSGSFTVVIQHFTT